jgi:4-amino-4-deoxy-L-arabinose transferase-like glycosyltransferase
MSVWVASAQTVLRAGARRYGVEFAFLFVLVLAVYGLRIGDLTIRGEESRWAQVAREMIQTGDWIVPRQQGVPLLSRPPMQSWLIALASSLRGQMDVVAVRLPALLAILLTTLLVYLYARQFLDRLGALASGCAFATFAEVLHLGRYAETEACFTFFVAAPLLLWHWGYSRGWSRTGTWLICFTLAGLGALTKGPQAPVYFVGGVGLFLLLRRDWRWLFCTGSLLGVLAFLAVVGAWQIPFAHALGWRNVLQLWVGETAMRWHPRNVMVIVRHLTGYPLEVAGCLLPWSLLLLAYASRSFRENIGAARPMVLFLTACLLVAFPTCWLTPDAITRYFFPMYPCVAPLIGLVVQRMASSRLPDFLVKLNCGARISMAGIMVAIAGLVLAVSWLPMPSSLAPWAQPGGFAIGYAIAVLVAGMLLWRLRAVAGRAAGHFVVLALTCFLGLTYSAVVVNALRNRSIVVGPEVAQVQSLIPPGQRLVSLDPVHHLFAFYYPELIPLHPLPCRADQCKDFSYFCLHIDKGHVPALPFEWEQLALVPMERNRQQQPEQMELIGRVVDADATLPLANHVSIATFATGLIHTPAGAAGSSARQTGYRPSE